MDAEESMVTKLKVEVGIIQVNKMTKMVTDLRVTSK